MKNYKKNLCLLYIFYFLTLIIMYYAKIRDLSSPFFYAFIFNLMYFRVSIVFIIVSYLIIQFVTVFSIYNIAITVAIATLLIIITIIHKFSKKPITIPLIALYYLISQFIGVFKEFNINSIIISIIGFISLFCFIDFFKAFHKKGNVIHFTADQNICGGILLIAIGMGLSQFEYFSEYILKFIGTMIIFTIAYTYSSPVCCIYGILLGVGSSFYSDTTYLFYFTFISVFCYAFKGYNTFMSCLSVIVAELILGLYFELYGYYMYTNLIAPILSAILFFIFHKRISAFTKNLFGTNLNTYGVKTLVNRNKEQICYKMNELSQVFNEMNRLYSGLIKGKMSDEEVYHVLTDNAIKNLCVNCPGRKKCFEIDEKDRTINQFMNLFKSGIEKGKVGILDLSSNMNRKCNKINQLLSVMNSLIANFKEYKQMMKSSDLSKLLVAEQLKGVSSLLDMLSMEIGTTILFNSKLEQRIREELAYCDILCEEVLCYEINDSQIVSIVINNSNIINPLIAEKVISKIMNHSYSMTLEQIGNYGNIYEFKPSPRFGYLFGASGKGKESISGDTFSFTKISKNRVMFAICDGMGTGKNAQNISEISLNLIENFYKAGYDSQIILSSVNKLLSTGSNENYSALDIVVLDLAEGYSNFIKLGAPDGVIRTKNGMERIRAGALPLGILEEIEPMILERDLSQNDMICMFSDGIVDSFGGLEMLTEFIESQNTTNPQTLADKILNQSIACSGSEDDKTVICIRTFLNY